MEVVPSVCFFEYSQPQAGAASCFSACLPAQEHKLSKIKTVMRFAQGDLTEAQFPQVWSC